jgi:hypothetical protein
VPRRHACVSVIWMPICVTSKRRPRSRKPSPFRSSSRVA